jgi:hypothetical protein
VAGLVRTCHAASVSVVAASSSMGRRGKDAAIARHWSLQQRLLDFEIHPVHRLDLEADMAIKEIEHAAR